MTIDSTHNRPSVRRRPRVITVAAGTFAAAVALSMLACGAGSPSAAGAGSRTATVSHGAQTKQTRSATVPPELFGVQPGPTTIDAADGATIASTGVRTVRIGLNWLWVQPRPGSFNWSRIDEVVAALAASGVQALPTLAATPSWVTQKPTTPPIGSKEKKQAWKSFVTAAVRRYGPAGAFWRPGPLGKSPFHFECGCTAAPVPITEWQVWNEPNLVHYFTPKPSPVVYARLLHATHSAIRKVDRNAQVDMAGLSDGGRMPDDMGATTYLKRLYKVRRVKRSFDAVAIHPYARKVSGMRSVIEEIRGVMKGHHQRRTPLIVTEFGWGSAPPNGYGTTKGIQGQRRIVKRAMKMFLHRRKGWHLQHVYWFFWRDPPKTGERLPCRICNSAGLLRSDRTPKPAYRAFKRIARRGL